MPLGVVFPRHADDVAATVRLAGELGVAGRSPAGRAPAWPGRRSGRASCSTCPGTWTGSSSWTRRPGRRGSSSASCRTSSTGPPPPYGLMFGPDTSTSNRATIGGMIGNNSAGSGSVRYGMTIDHVRALDVVLSDGSRARFEPVDEAERRRRARRRTPWRAGSTGGCRELVERERARPSRPGSRRSGAGPAATGSTGWPTGRRSTWRSSWSAPRGRWRSSPRPWSAWCPSRRARCSRSATSTSVQARHRATDGRAVLRPGPGRADGPDHPRPVPAEDRVRRAWATSCEGDPEALLFVSFTGDDEAELVAPARRLDRAVGQARPRLPHAARGHPGPAGRAAQGAQVQPRAC